jgi:sarcosine/dimethylglycine N-methyltransferase
MNKEPSVVEKAKSYYDSQDADEFYFRIWGGEDIHIGLYDPPSISIKDASKKTVEKMSLMLGDRLHSTSKILDMGSGYGGAARYISQKYNCSITCLNLSPVENERNREMNQKAGLGDKIEVVDGNFEDMPFPDNEYDIVWSEDAILHSGNKEIVFQEVHRILKPEGSFIFTDPMQSDDCPEGVLKPVYDRIHLDSMGSFAFYSRLAEKNQFQKLEIIDYSQFLPIHYDRVRSTILERREEFKGMISDEFIEKMLVGLGHWVDAGKKGYLSWGILHFQKS